MHIKVSGGLNKINPAAIQSLENSKGLSLFYDEHEVRHPLAMYNLSLAAIASRTNSVLDILESVEKEYYLYINSKGEGFSWERPLLEAMDHFLDTLMEHMEECKYVIRTFFSKSSNKEYNKIYTAFKKEVLPYRDYIGAIDNYLKHNQGRLRLVCASNSTGLVPGYFVEGPTPGGGIGPVSRFHGESGNPFSFYRDIRFHICNVYATSTRLAHALHTINSDLSETNSVTADDKLSEWHKMMIRVAKLPNFFFPKELAKPYPFIFVDDNKMKLEYPSQKKANKLVGVVAISTNYTGDGVSTTFKIPEI